jgi:hypothetical protein
MEDTLGPIQQAIEGLILPKHAARVTGVVGRGKQILYHESTHKKIFGDISNMTVDSDPQKLAMGVAGLLTMMRKENGEGFPDDCLVPISALLLCDVIQFMGESGALEPTTEFIGNAFEELLAIMMQKVGVGPEEIDAMLAEEGQINPADPMAEEPGAPMPEEPMPPAGVIEQAQQVPQ